MPASQAGEPESWRAPPAPSSQPLAAKPQADNWALTCFRLRCLVFTPGRPPVSSTNRHSFSTPNPLDTFLFPDEQRRNVFARLYGSHQSHPRSRLCKAAGGRCGGRPPFSEPLQCPQKTGISAEIHIGKWISHRKHCFSLRGAFNPLKFLSNLPCKCLSGA